MEINEPATDCFTDGSFQSGSSIIGCAAVFEDRRISAILTRHPTTFCSSTTAELGAIHTMKNREPGNDILDSLLALHNSGISYLQKKLDQRTFREYPQ
jgi:hypothetical protein